MTFDPDEFIAFNKAVYPSRRHVTIDRYVNWRLNGNPINPSYLPVLHVENGEILAQIVPLATRVMIDGIWYDGVWGSDYIARPDQGGGTGGMLVLRRLLKRHLHFAVGMSDISLKIHKAFKERSITTRYSSFGFLRTKKKITCSVVPAEKALDQLSQQDYYNNFNHFDRSPTHIDWLFHQADKSNLVLLYSDHCHILLYKVTRSGVPIWWVLDYSASLHDVSSKITGMIAYFLDWNPLKFIWFHGTTDISNDLHCFQHRQEAVLSNYHVKLGLDSIRSWHITALDSDRFVNYFL